MDEPTAALAVREVEHVLDLIRNLKSHDIAVVGAIDAGDRLHQRRFSSAVVADEADDAARFHGEGDAAQRLDRSERLAHVLEFEKAHRRQPPELLMRSSQTARISTAPIAICW